MVEVDNQNDFLCTEGNDELLLLAERSKRADFWSKGNEGHDKFWELHDCVLLTAVEQNIALFYYFVEIVIEMKVL